MICKTVGGSANSTDRNDAVACIGCLPPPPSNNTATVSQQRTALSWCMPVSMLDRASKQLSNTSNTTSSSTSRHHTSMCVRATSSNGATTHAVHPPKASLQPHKAVQPTQHARQHQLLCGPQCTTAATACSRVCTPPPTLPFAHTCSFSPKAQCTHNCSHCSRQGSQPHTLPQHPPQLHTCRVPS